MSAVFNVCLDLVGGGEEEVGGGNDGVRGWRRKTAGPFGGIWLGFAFAAYFWVREDDFSFSFSFSLSFDLKPKNSSFRFPSREVAGRASNIYFVERE